MTVYEIIGTAGIIMVFIMFGLSLKFSRPCKNKKC